MAHLLRLLRLVEGWGVCPCAWPQRGGGPLDVDEVACGGGGVPCRLLGLCSPGPGSSGDAWSHVGVFPSTGRSWASGSARVPGECPATARGGVDLEPRGQDAPFPPHWALGCPPGRRPQRREGGGRGACGIQRVPGWRLALRRSLGRCQAGQVATAGEGALSFHRAVQAQELRVLGHTGGPTEGRTGP